MKRILKIMIVIFALTIFFTGCGSETKREPGEGEMNVLISDMPGEDPFVVTSGAAPDPFITFDEKAGFYYGMSTQNGYIMLHRSKKLSEIFKGGESLIVYRVGNEITDCLWAPEMYFADGHWYIYSSGTIPGADSTKRLFVLESETEDPFDGFHFKNYLNNNLFAIDPTVWNDSRTGKSYICFSIVKYGCQGLAIAELENPYTMGTETIIAFPGVYDWEGTVINEGPFFVENQGKVFIVFSANGCYDDNYCLGLLELTKPDNPTDQYAWRKAESPILVKSEDVFAPGHASFFKSPDGTETWVAYHCYYSHNENNIRRMRVCHVQPVSFDEEGRPYIKEALSGDSVIKVPSGEQ